MPSGLLDRKELRRTDRYIQFGLVAAREALDQAGLPERFEGDLAERTGVILGTGLGGVGTLIDGFTTNALRGPDRISPFLIPMGIPNIGAGQVAIQFGMTGPELHDRVGLCDRRPRARRVERDHPPRRRRRHGRRWRRGRPSTRRRVGGFAAMRALSTRNDDPEAASRPFDTGRDGFVIGEGAGVVILEALEHAEARGATILAELVGYGATADASHITLPAPGGIGAVRAARRAIDKAGLDARRHRPRQRPRDLDARGRQGRAAGDPDDLRRPRRSDLDHRQQVDARTHARRGRRDRGHRLDPDHPRRLRPADDQPRRTRTPRRRAST